MSDSTGGLPVTAHDRGGGRPTTAGLGVVVAAVLGTALAYMSDDMLNLATPSVARDLGATLTDIQWIVNGYYVLLVSLVLVAGSIGDIYGHRRIFTAGLLVFSVGALICASAEGVAPLIAGRAVQGVAAAMLLTAGLALVVRLTPPERRSRAIGQFLGLAAAVPALGPFISGALVDLLSWRWLFVVPLLLPLTALLIVRLLVPETPRALDRRPDFAGAIAAVMTLGGFGVALILGSTGTPGMTSIVALAVGLAGMMLLFVAERRARDPMLPLEFFRRRVFLGGNIVWLLGSMTCWGAVFFLAVSLQTTLGLRPIAAGLVLVPIYVVMMVGSPVAGRLAERIGPRVPILGGLLLYGVGLWMLSWIGPGSAIVPDVMLAVVVLAVGMALFTAPLAAATMGALSEGEQGVAAGVNNAMGNLAGLLAVIILPALAGLGGATIGGPDFAAGYPAAMRAAAVLAGVAMVVAMLTFGLRPFRGASGSLPAPRPA